jgi:hypothetical protein
VVRRTADCGGGCGAGDAGLRFAFGGWGPDERKSVAGCSRALLHPPCGIPLARSRPASRPAVADGSASSRHRRHHHVPGVGLGGAAIAWRTPRRPIAGNAIAAAPYHAGTPAGGAAGRWEARGWEPRCAMCRRPGPYMAVTIGDAGSVSNPREVDQKGNRLDRLRCSNCSVPARQHDPQVAAPPRGSLRCPPGDLGSRTCPATAAATGRAFVAPPRRRRPGPSAGTRSSRPPVGRRDWSGPSHVLRGRPAARSPCRPGRGGGEWHGCTAGPGRFAAATPDTAGRNWPQPIPDDLRNRFAQRAPFACPVHSLGNGAAAGRPGTGAELAAAPVP